jgi:hypothetical protein
MLVNQAGAVMPTVRASRGSSLYQFELAEVAEGEFVIVFKG